MYLNKGWYVTTNGTPFSVNLTLLASISISQFVYQNLFHSRVYHSILELGCKQQMFAYALQVKKFGEYTDACQLI